MKKYPNSFLFFLIKNGQLFAWDYKNHNQFEIELNYLVRLIELSKLGTQYEYQEAIDKDLEEASFILAQSNEIDWQWDDLSKIFHFGTRIPNVELDKTLDNEKFIEEYYQDCESVLASIDDGLENPKSGHIINLPKPALESLSSKILLDALLKRKTCRSFDGKQLSFNIFNELIYSTLTPYSIILSLSLSFQLKESI